MDTNGIEGFYHVEKNRDCKSLLANVPSHYFNEARQLKNHGIFGTESKLLIT
jgi:hypothetical protein